VELLAEVSGTTPWLTISSRNVTVPVGPELLPVPVAVTVALTTSELPAAGVVVAGVTVVVVDALATVTVTAGDVDAE
jgi:hypothetical protein